MLPSRLVNAAIPKPVLSVLEQLSKKGYSAFLVGGCVRDLLRGVAPKDFDVATSALPTEVQPLFSKVIPTGIAHGTVTVLVARHPVEVTTFRAEAGYVDGRRPTSVTFHQDIEADLSRRDFTINAMAFDPLAGRFIDPFDGEADLNAGVIRAVGEARERFSEDGLRALRAVRFAAVLGFFLDARTETAIPETIEVFRKVSIERIREEFTKLLLSDRVEHGLQLLAKTRLLDVFLPEVVGGLHSSQVRVARSARRLELRLAALLLDLEPASTRAALVRLRYPNRTVDEVCLFARCCFGVAEAKAEADARRAAAQCGRDHLESVLELVEAQLGQPQPNLRQLYAKALQGQPALQMKELALSGRDIMALLQVSPGPLVGEATRHLLDWVLENPHFNTPTLLKEELLRHVGQKDK